MTRTMLNTGIAALLALTFGACGGDSSPTAPRASDGTIAQTITITAAGVSPKDVTVALGQRVLFVNNDAQAHTINSDPHPSHGDCPAIDDVGFIAPGSSKATSNLTTARSCGYHDHNLFPNAAFQGTIRVQ